MNLQTKWILGRFKFHKSDIPLRSVVSSIGSPVYVLARFLRKILSPLAGKSKSFVNNSGYFLQLLKSVNHQPIDTFVSFGFVSFSLMYQSMKPCKSLEIRSVTMTHWKNGMFVSRSHHRTAGSLLENRIVPGGLQVLPTERWHGCGKFSVTHR
jgi:hypothetical protein